MPSDQDDIPGASLEDSGDCPAELTPVDAYSNARRRPSKECLWLVTPDHVSMARLDCCTKESANVSRNVCSAVTFEGC